MADCSVDTTSIVHRFLDFNEAIETLRQALFAGLLNGVCLDTHGQRSFIERLNWGGDAGPTVLMRGVAWVSRESDISPPNCRPVFLSCHELNQFILSLPDTPASAAAQQQIPSGCQENKSRQEKPKKQRAIRAAIDVLWPGGIDEIRGIQAKQRDKMIEDWIKSNRSGMTVSERLIRQFFSTVNQEP
jgi:hypothetical protein